jgi:hypothetical protein
VTTFASHIPVTTKVTTAMQQLHQARRDGDAVAIYVASKHLAVALELLPVPSRTLAETGSRVGCVAASELALKQLDQLRKEAYAALEDAIVKVNAMLIAAEDENDDDDTNPEMMAVDAVLLIGSQWIDEEGDRNGVVNIIPRNGWQPGYITAGLLATAQARVIEP